MQMHVVSAPRTASHLEAKTQIIAADIPYILDHYADKIKVLSLDCFDTLLWRKTATPRDVFYDMQHHPAFQQLGVTAYQRIASAARAYRTKWVTHHLRQVSLADIYHAFSSLNEEQKALLIEAELQSEIDACYAFPYFVELIRQAAKRGIKIIIVSDIYMHASQLRQLLASHLPEDVMRVISEIFCSIDYGTSKSEELFRYVLTKTAEIPASILHIGDHRVADHDAPKKHGIHALHFLQFNRRTTNFLRLHHSASSLAFLSHPSPHYARQARYSPFRGLFSLKNPLSETPACLIGYMTFGPILYAFARFIDDELTALQQTGKRIKPFFLLRDAYLLFKACEAYTGKPVGQLARIRKFVAVAASFRTREDVDHYLSGILPQHYNMWVICEQLLLSKEIIMQIIETANRSTQPQETFNQLIHQDHILKIVFENSANARAKLKKYILKHMKLEPGDTLVLIDTGYLGVTQDFLTRALADELQIEIIGRYLIASHEPDRPACKSLITSSWCEHGLFEQSCTFKEGAVLTYDEEGNPVFDALKLSDQQYEKVQAIQKECLHFINDAKQFFTDASIKISYDILQKYAETCLHRHIFFPLAEEIHYFSDFQHDKDMGHDLKKTMFNLNQAMTALQHSPTYKTHPYEARAIHLDASLSALVQRAFELDFSPEEKSYLHENLRVITMKDDAQHQLMVPAFPTTNGFYHCTVPFAADHHIGFAFGEHYQWVQIEKIQLMHPAVDLLNNENIIVLNKMKRYQTLFECEANDALLMLWPLSDTHQVMTCQIVFRPIIRRNSH